MIRQSILEGRSILHLTDIMKLEGTLGENIYNNLKKKIVTLGDMFQIFSPFSRV
jgi:hypothetical protein